MVDLSRIAFIDLEASSLSSGSFPTEIGWAIPDRDTNLVRSGSCLIRPLAKWLRSGTAWSPASEALTGISQRMLEQDGVPPVEAMTRLFTAVGDRDLYADEIAWDKFWLAMVADASSMDLGERKLDDAKRLVADLVGSDARLKRALRQAEEEAVRRVPKRHRAEDDARRLAIVYSLLIQQRV